MSVSFYEIDKRLIAAVEAVDASTPKSYPNKPLSSYPEGLWIAVHVLPVESNPATLGSQGEDYHPGILQIDVNYPVNRGTRQALEKIDEFIAAFPAGEKLGYGITVTSNTRVPSRVIDGYYRVSASINYYTQQPRN